MVAVIEQIAPSLDLAEIGAFDFRQSRSRSRLRSDGGRPRQIDAILVQQIESQEHQLAFVGMAPAHLGHQSVEMSRVPRIDQAKARPERGFG
jgi:hypothetical protein